MISEKQSDTTKITIQLSQSIEDISFDHPNTIVSHYNINKHEREIKFTEKSACNFFIDQYYLLQRYFNGKSFKISLPIKMDVSINDRLFESYCQLRVSKLMSKKWKNKCQFKIRNRDYILVPWNDQKITKQNKQSEIFINKESYMQPFLLLNTIAALDNSYEKYWSSEIYTPMYS